ncbi:hypothetical protein GCK32_000375 [Trichostrongylus colubriformis]|uniref:Uncharacterized protein n=1 Tax=Trichostrongylus colubriformis TaxID=6319 RepID=A0AAN8FXX2_TRICO
MHCSHSMSKSINRQSMLVVSLALLCLCLSVSAVECPPRCSPHITLPCSFPSLDPCMVKTCEMICRKDDDRGMIGCFCRGSLEGAATRTCFCGPSKNHDRNLTVVF